MGALKDNPDEVNTEIPPHFDLQGAKLATLSQVTAYQRILAEKPK